MKEVRKKILEKKKGIALYMAVVITAALALISIAVINITLKEFSISSTSRESQQAFYAADSGIECALYWDLKNTVNLGISAFATSTPSQQITCDSASTAITVTNVSNSTTTFSFVLPNNNCVTVGVYKLYVSGSPKTQISARGYNKGSVLGTGCTSSSAKRVERAIYVSY